MDKSNSEIKHKVKIDYKGIIKPRSLLLKDTQLILQEESSEKTLLTTAYDDIILSTMTNPNTSKTEKLKLMSRKANFEDIIITNAKEEELLILKEKINSKLKLKKKLSSSNFRAIIKIDNITNLKDNESINSGSMEKNSRNSILANKKTSFDFQRLLKTSTKENKENVIKYFKQMLNDENKLDKESVDILFKSKYYTITNGDITQKTSNLNAYLHKKVLDKEVIGNMKKLHKSSFDSFNAQKIIKMMLIVLFVLLLIGRIGLFVKDINEYKEFKENRFEPNCDSNVDINTSHDVNSNNVISTLANASPKKLLNMNYSKIINSIVKVCSKKSASLVIDKIDDITNLSLNEFTDKAAEFFTNSSNIMSSQCFLQVDCFLKYYSVLFTLIIIIISFILVKGKKNIFKLFNFSLILDINLPKSFEPTDTYNISNYKANTYYTDINIQEKTTTSTQASQAKTPVQPNISNNMSSRNQIWETLNETKEIKNDYYLKTNGIINYNILSVYMKLNDQSLFPLWRKEIKQVELNDNKKMKFHYYSNSDKTIIVERQVLHSDSTIIIAEISESVIINLFVLESNNNDLFNKTKFTVYSKVNNDYVNEAYDSIFNYCFEFIKFVSFELNMEIYFKNQDIEKEYKEEIKNLRKSLK